MSYDVIDIGTLSRAEYDQRCALLKSENRKYGLAMEPLSEIYWPPAKTRPIAIFRSCSFLAQVYAPVNGGQRISVCRTQINRDGNWKADISWEELMAVKSECGFSACWAVEIFPPNSEVVNVANLRHLWVTEAPPFAWRNV
jgi:hypothetical protein